MDITTDQPTLTDTPPKIKKVAPPDLSIPGPPVRRVTNSDEWSRLVQYYAECLERENRQQYLVETNQLWPFSLEAGQVRNFMHGTKTIEFQVVRKPYPNSITRFIDAKRDKTALKLCLGFPFLVYITKEQGKEILKAAPLLFAPLSFSEQDERFILIADNYEFSYAALKTLQLDDEQISLFLNDLENIQPQPGQDILEAMEDRLVEKIHEAYQEPLPRVQDEFVHATIYSRPALFWVSENTATKNLILELKDLAKGFYWEKASPALRQILTALPDHEYPPAVESEADPNIYVTPVNDSQRRAVAAAAAEPVVVVTGPPGTGKSQLVLNMITQAFLDGQTVLFASRNNNAVDVVMSRLKSELKFQGAVRTGSKEKRLSAVTDMKNSLNTISTISASIDMDKLNESYRFARNKAQEAEKQLNEVRRIKGLATSHQEERDWLLRQLQEPLGQLVRNHLPAFYPLEIQSLDTTTTALHGRGLKLKEEKHKLLHHYKQVLIENQSNAGLVNQLRFFEESWGSFAGGFLHREQFDRLTDLQTHLQTWQDLIRAYNSLSQRNTQKQRCDRLGKDIEIARQSLAEELADEAEILAAKFPPTALSEFQHQFSALVQSFESIAADKSTLWKKILLRLGLHDPLRPEIERFTLIHTQLGTDPEIIPTHYSAKDMTRVARDYAAASHQKADALAFAELQRLLNDASTEMTRISTEAEAFLLQLSDPVRQDLGKMIPSQVDNTVLLSEINSLQAELQSLQTGIAGLAEHAAQKLAKNSDRLEMLNQFHNETAESCPWLWIFETQVEIEALIQRLAQWHNLVTFWETETRLRSLEQQLAAMLDETAAIQAVQKASVELLNAGGEILRKTWEVRSRKMPNEVLQGAQDYVQAVEQLSQEYNPSTFPFLRKAEENNLHHAVKVFPVWATTNLSARPNFKLDAGYFDLVIIDEASQCDVPSALPLLYRAKRMVIIGDPNQLRHIATLTTEANNETASKHGVANEAFSYNEQSLFDLAHRAAGAQPGFLLLNHHYRSDPRIINFSNQFFYNNQLLIKTDFSRRNIPIESIQAYGGIHWLQVNGKAKHPHGGSAFNQEEINIIQQLIPKMIESLKRRNMAEASIGIVSPYKEQEERIQRWVRETYGENHHITVGTAHKFQGDERDIMIFSTVLGPDLKEGSLRWLQVTRNLLNVAVTRARISLIVVGNWEFCRSLPSEHCFRQLADYTALQPERVVREMQDISLITTQAVSIVGTVVGTCDPEYARTTLRRFIASCLDYVWWTDPYFDDRVFRLFSEVFQDAGVKIHEIHLLAAEEAFEPKDNRLPKLDADKYIALQSDLMSRGIDIALRVLPMKQMPHDRLFFSPGQAINMPPFDNAYGSHTRLSEYTHSAISSDNFKNYWERARDI